jgi:hypothetical protein
MREPYICPYCNQRSTRRWNLDVHIKRKHDGYLLGKSSGLYVVNNPPLYSKSLQLGDTTIADNVGETLQPRYIPPQILQNFNPLYRPQHTMDDRNSLSQGKILKIHELKRLMNKYPRYHTNPDGIIRLAVYNSINGDNTLLDDKLEQLRTIDSLSKY